MNADEPTFDASSFSRNRDRLLDHDVAAKFFAAVVRQARSSRRALGEGHRGCRSDSPGDRRRHRGPRSWDRPRGQGGPWQARDAVLRFFPGPGTGARSPRGHRAS
ncbi:MAG: transposase [Deltaproteobacteria bacterium]|nr:transposase [Deltaproteobacteria bacterium]